MNTRAIGSTKSAEHLDGRTGGAGVALAALILAGCAPGLHLIASGADIIPNARAATALDGTVVAAAPHRILAGNTGYSTAIDLTGYGLTIPTAAYQYSPIQVDANRNIVFIADRPGDADCPQLRGVYLWSVALAVSGVRPQLLWEDPCLLDPLNPRSMRVPLLSQVAFVAMSAHGTIAFGKVTNGQGAPLWGRITTAGAVATPFTPFPIGDWFNSRELDVNDNGRVMALMEYQVVDPTDATRIIYLPDILGRIGTTGSGLEIMDSSAATASSLAISESGVVVYANGNGVYVATPTPRGTATPTRPVATVSATGYCAFGAVDIGAYDSVVFEAKVHGRSDCSPGGAFEGLYTGPNPSIDALIMRGDAPLGDHQRFDGIQLGRANLTRTTISFTTRRAAPGVDPVKVWSIIQ
jgi:hypothetical protein